MAPTLLNTTTVPSLSVDGVADALAAQTGGGLARTDESQGFTLLRDASTGEVSLANVALVRADDHTRSALWSATSSAVTLTWGRTPGVSRFAVSRDGVPVTVSAITSFVDRAVAAGQTHTYVIRSVATSEAVADAGRTYGFTVTVPGEQTPAKAAADAAAAAAAVSKTSAVHETYIPQQYLSAPPAGCGSYNGSTYSFGGDNRGWVADDYRYRTRVFGTVDWTQNGALVVHTTYVGSTHVYRTSTHALLATKTASSSGLSVSRLAGGNSTRVDLRFNGQATNPFCTGIPNSIDFVFTLTLTRARSWSIVSGSHKQMPNHELYIKDAYATNWVTAYRRSYASAACLINGACERASMVGLYGSY